MHNVFHDDNFHVYCIVYFMYCLYVPSITNSNTETIIPGILYKPDSIHPLGGNQIRTCIGAVF